MGNGDLAVLMAALLLVTDLILDLERAGARLDHLLGEEISRLGIAEAGVDVGDDGDDMGLEILDPGEQITLLRGVAGFARGVDVVEQQRQFARIGLAQEGVEFRDQRRHARLLVHRLIGQRAEFGAQGRDHPARQIQVFAPGRAEMLLDADHLLLRDEAVPAAERLGVGGGIGVVGGHVGAHDPGGIARDVEPGEEAVLQPHPRDRLGADPVPGVAVRADELLGLIDGLGVDHGEPFTILTAPTPTWTKWTVVEAMIAAKSGRLVKPYAVEAV